MGTRNLVCVVKDGEYKIAQYGQWDGYPSGQGVTVLDFISDNAKLEKLKEQLSKVRFLDREGIDKNFIAEYDKNSPQWSNEPDNRTPEQIRWFERYVSRNIGGKILDTVAFSTDNEMVLKDSSAFAGDSLYCEYAYVVDLDKDTFEVYEGFNKEPVLEGRFISGEKNLEKSGNDEYHPVALLKSYDLSDLPSKETFLKETENSEDDDE